MQLEGPMVEHPSSKAHGLTHCSILSMSQAGRMKMHFKSYCFLLATTMACLHVLSSATLKSSVCVIEHSYAPCLELLNFCYICGHLQASLRTHSNDLQAPEPGSITIE